MVNKARKSKYRNAIKKMNLLLVEKKKDEVTFTPKAALLDFNIGYAGAIILGILFLCLGYFVMFNTGETFSNKAATFSKYMGVRTKALAFTLVSAVPLIPMEALARA